MSEYQYYEFQAIDRPLTEKEMAALRAHSTRARITPTGFVNDYAWGSFKGDEDAWVEKYFDAFVYLANWGTRSFRLRLPARLLDENTARPYCPGNAAGVRQKNGSLILSFHSEDEDGGDHVEGEGQLSSLIPVRAELARGDLRALYVGWLLCAQGGELEDDELEPPVPAGLGQLSGSQESLAAFLRIDGDLLAVAAAASPPLAADPEPAQVREWVANLPVAEKDDLLARFIAGDGALANELVRRMRRERGEDPGAGGSPRRRTVAELLAAAGNAREERRRLEAERAAKAKARREREAALARTKQLDELDGRGAAIWGEVEELIAAGLPKSYAEAVRLLLDLRELAARKRDDDGFQRRLATLRRVHARRPALIRSLEKAGLR